MKDIQDIYSESHKMSLRELKEDLDKWRDVPCSWIGKVHNVKM